MIILIVAETAPRYYMYKGKMLGKTTQETRHVAKLSDIYGFDNTARIIYADVVDEAIEIKEYAEQHGIEEL